MAKRSTPAKKTGQAKRTPVAAVTAAQGSDGKSIILAAALKAFAKDTFDGASLPEIARSAGIGGPLIHYHFGSKENLWRATVDYAFRQLENPFRAIAATAKDLEPRDALKMLCRALANFSTQYPEHVLVLMNEVRSPGPRFEWVMQTHLKNIHEIMDGIIERSSRKRQIKAIPAVYLTNAILGMITHFFASRPLVSALYGENPNDPAIADQYIEWTMEIIFKGIEVK